ncbi:MAG: chemotaxis protein CheW [Coprothermobacterota bacterium]|nr:chemotaxis protein CheW [Coprothermobacterota bacterium]
MSSQWKDSPSAEVGEAAAGSYLLVFSIGDRRCALSLAEVERVVRAAAVTPLPHLPETILGMIDIQGEVLPVIDLRVVLGLPVQPLSPGDQFIIAHTPVRRLTLVIDQALEVHHCLPENVTDSSHVFPGSDQVKAILRDEQGLIQVLNLAQLLNQAEEKALTQALEP